MLMESLGIRQPVYNPKNKYIVSLLNICSIPEKHSNHPN